MIARMTATASPALLLSSRLGLVSVPDLDLGSLSREEELDRNTVRECLQSLGQSMGLTSLARNSSFPESPALAEDGGDASDPEFPDAAVRKSLEGLDAVWLQDDEP